ncbi:MAG: extracellular solute-binding protein, partial [Verrucomicrobiota bacterium]
MAGHLETVRDAATGETKTVIHITLHDWIWFELDPVRTETGIRANAKAVRAFIHQFPKLFEERYRKKYEADPERYGRHHWDRVEVRVEEFSGIKIEGVESDLLAIAGRMAPDIIYLNFRKSDTYIQQGFLYPLDRPEDGYLTAMTEEEKAWRIHEKFWPVIHRRGPGGKQVWALPHGGAIGKVLIYRKDFFDEAGVPYPDETWTWDDLYEACRKLADPGRGKYAIALRNTKDESWRWMDFLFAAGSQVMHYDDTADRWSIAFDNTNTVSALEYYVKLCNEPWTDAEGRTRRGYAYRAAHYAASAQAWKNGDIAILLGTIQEEVFAKSFDPTLVGLAPMPIGPTGIRKSALNTKMMALFAQIEEPAVRDAAWEFIRFYGSKEAAEIKTRALVEGGLGRFVNPATLKVFGYEELIRFAPPGWQQTFELSVEHSEP